MVASLEDRREKLRNLDAFVDTNGAVAGRTTRRPAELLGGSRDGR
jgi:hypothetical protein